MKTYRGGCHCQNVAYEVDMDLSEVMECNCTHCAKKGFLLTFVPQAQFRLVKGSEALTEYRFNKKHISHLFCSTCGVQSFGRGEGPSGPTVAINVRCLDNVDVDALIKKGVDGKNF